MSKGAALCTSHRARTYLTLLVPSCGAYLRNPLQVHRTHIPLCYLSILVMEATKDREG